MMFKGKNIFNASFDVYAGNYHNVRPGYPLEMYEDIKKHCELGESSSVLEIGSGSGIATVELAKMGSRVTGIEPGSNLASIAKAQVREYKKADVLEGTFEDFSSREQFDAVLAFTAFHWLNEGERYEKILSLLNDSGSFVLVWNSFFQDGSQASVDVNKAYLEMLPDVYPEVSDVAAVNTGVLSKLNGREQEVVASPLFTTVLLKKYFSVYNYDEDTYPKFLNTYPKIVKIDEDLRTAFFKRISEVVKKQGGISVPVLTTLIICKRKNSFLEQMANPQPEPEKE